MAPVEKASVLEMEVAEALLELQHDSRETQRETASENQNPQQVITNEVGNGANDNNASTSVRPGPIHETQFRVTSGDSRHFNGNKNCPSVIKLPLKRYLVSHNNSAPKNREQYYRHLGPLKKRLNLYQKHQHEQRQYKAQLSRNTKKTQDMATQTDNDFDATQIEEMESFIKELCGKIVLLSKQLESYQKSPVHERTKQEITPPESTTVDESPNSKTNYVRRAKTSFSSNTLPSVDSDGDPAYRESDGDMDHSDSDQSISSKDNSSDHERIVENTTEMVSIGEGNATVPSKLLKQMNWSSYTNATRKLLTAVFSRKVLATHSMTGKRSPAFPNKPAKKRLDPALVNDIVQTVVDRCKVPENVVRTSITTKCADESKMFRSRQQKKWKRRLSKKENTSPYSSDTED